MDDAKAAGATVAVISPQTPDKAAESVKKNGLSMPVLSDAGNQVAAAYGLRHGFRDDLAELYRSFGIDLAKYNGDDGWTLPIPARLIIDPNGIVGHVDADPDYTRRPEPADTLATLRALRGG